MNSINENLKIINEKINDCIIKNNRPQNSVKLLAVSKFHPVEEIIQAIDSNQFMFGENHVQEAVSKFPTLMDYNKNVSLHMIGQLQTNKVKDIVKICDYIQSVDRIKLVNEIEKQCSKINKKVQILFEIHTGEESKSGFTNESDFYHVINEFAENKFPHIIPCGFMTMAPFTNDEILIHKSFEKLRLFKEKIQKEYPQFNLSELSMGMSNDFEIAIQEGSTIVRVGTAIFGERNYNK